MHWFKASESAGLGGRKLKRTVTAKAQPKEEPRGYGKRLQHMLPWRAQPVSTHKPPSVAIDALLVILLLLLILGPVTKLFYFIFQIEGLTHLPLNHPTNA